MSQDSCDDGEQEHPPQSAMVETPTRSWSHAMATGSTVIIAFATLVNLVVSIGLWISTRDSVDVARQVFEAANRPYIGAEGINPNNDMKKRTMNINAAIKNFGTAPGENAHIDWIVMLNGTIQPGEKIPDRPQTLFPGDHVFLTGFLSGPIYEKVMDGQMVLSILLQASYDGPSNKTYRFCEKHHYKPELNAFLNLGSCDEKEPARKN